MRRPKPFSIPATCPGCRSHVWLTFADGPPTENAYWTCMQCLTRVPLWVLGRVLAVQPRGRAGSPEGLKLDAKLTCPACGVVTQETMPVNYCLRFYDCTSCGHVMTTKPEDCCVYCSHGDTLCPPRQAGQCGCPPEACKGATA